jgi:hypothetical protein
MLVGTAMALCLAAFAWFTVFDGTGGGGGAQGGYVAVGAAGPSAEPDHPVPPYDKVTFVPLPDSTPPAQGAAGGSPTPSGAQAAAPVSRANGSAPGSPSVTPSAPGTPTAAGSGSGTPQPPPARPAHLTVSALERTPAEQSYCENVTLTFTNSGDLPVTSGTVTFETHIIGLLGLDWGTVDTTQPLPTPIPGGHGVRKTYQVCVDSWRVLLGMHIETRDVTLSQTS